jgi:CheY-like chemotaxis protein
VQRASALTHRLLAFSRRQPLDPKPVAANPLIIAMENLLRRTIGEHITLDLELAGDLWMTLCDANQLDSAILNLTINARDAMPDGGRLTIRTSNAYLDAAQAANAGDYVCVRVTDTGTGMTPDVLERAFDPFFTTKPIGQGTGLGLSMIYGFMRQSGGHARIESEPGKGTSVSLYLPRSLAEAADDDTLPFAQATPHRADEGATVLVLEDEIIVRGIVVEVLEDLGYRAIEAADGPAGLEILRAGGRIDLVITDIGLPGLNGRQVAEAARLLRPELKILFMTGYAETAAMADGFLQPGMQMITKPFAIHSLATRIKTIIETG